MPKKIIVDHEECTGCLMCVQACSLVKTGSFNPASSRIRIVDWEARGVTVPVICQHCAEPICMPACPEEAISKDLQTGVVSIDPELCTNCTVCRRACPYAGPVFSAPEKKVLLCDYCGGTPTCVNVCPTEALHYQDYETGSPGQRLTAMEEVRNNLASA